MTDSIRATREYIASEVIVVSLHRTLKLSGFRSAPGIARGLRSKPVDSLE